MSPPRKKTKHDDGNVMEGSAPVLPTVVLGRLCDHLAMSGYAGTLASLLVTSKDMYDLAAPRLYDTVRVGAIAFVQLLGGLDFKRMGNELEYDPSMRKKPPPSLEDVPWPNPTSHARKLALLRRIKHLVLEGFPYENPEPYLEGDEVRGWGGSDTEDDGESEEQEDCDGTKGYQETGEDGQDGEIDLNGEDGGNGEDNDGDDDDQGNHEDAEENGDGCEDGSEVDDDYDPEHAAYWAEMKAHGFRLGQLWNHRKRIVLGTETLDGLQLAIHPPTQSLFPALETLEITGQAFGDIAPLFYLDKTSGEGMGYLQLFDLISDSNPKHLCLTYPSVPAAMQQAEEAGFVDQVDFETIMGMDLWALQIGRFDTLCLHDYVPGPALDDDGNGPEEVISGAAPRIDIWAPDPTTEYATGVHLEPWTPDEEVKYWLEATKRIRGYDTTLYWQESQGMYAQDFSEMLNTQYPPVCLANFGVGKPPDVVDKMWHDFVDKSAAEMDAYPNLGKLLDRKEARACHVCGTAPGEYKDQVL